MKDYIIMCERPKLDGLYSSLADYKPERFKLLSGVAVRVEDEREQSLLEKLASMEGISFHEARTYKALGEKHD